MLLCSTNYKNACVGLILYKVFSKCVCNLLVMTYVVCLQVVCHATNYPKLLLVRFYEVVAALLYREGPKTIEVLSAHLSRHMFGNNIFEIKPKNVFHWAEWYV